MKAWASFTAFAFVAIFCAALYAWTTPTRKPARMPVAHGCYWSGVDGRHPDAVRLISHDCIEPIWCPKFGVNVFINRDFIVIYGEKRSCVRSRG